MDAGFEAHLRVGEVRFDATDAELLRTVDARGSLNRAADALGRSYSRALERLTELEDALGPLVERQRGGSGGGGSELTDDARELLARFDRLRAEFTGTAEVEETVLAGRVVERHGELATVEIDTGRLRALVPDGSDRVQLNVRADAVTLHEPADAPDAAATSARNRFAGTVAAVDRGEAVARVVVDVSPDVSLTALVTTASVEKLGLETGAEVVTSFKATATRASPREE